MAEIERRDRRIKELEGQLERHTGGWHSVDGRRFQSTHKDMHGGFIKFLEKDDKNIKWLQEEILTRRYL